MMDMMVADVGGEPAHDGAGFQKAGGFQGCFVVCPTAALIKGDRREIVLRVKQVRTEGAGNEMWDDQREQQAGPTSKGEKDYRQGDVQTEGSETIKVAARISETWSDAHSVQKNDNVTEENRERMAHVEIFPADVPR